MKVIYMGSPDFAVYGLEALHAGDHEIVAVVSRVDKAKGRKKQLCPTAVKARALALGYPVYTPENVNDPVFLAELKSLGADVIVVSAYGRLLKKEALTLLPYGVLNIHGSLLPAYRGASPISAALRDGATETGITIMYMDEGMDEGDMLCRRSLPVGENTTFGELSAALGRLGGELIVEALDLLARGEAPREAQDPAAATYCQLLTREDEAIDWLRPGQAIHDLIRSLSPEPGAYTFWADAPFKIIESRFAPEETPSSAAVPGSLLGFDKQKGVAVAVDGGILYLLTVKPAGKKAMAAADWYRGLRQREAARFSSEK